MRKYTLTCIAISGLFLRESCWEYLSGYFEEFICIDSIRDKENLNMDEYIEALTAQIYKSKYPVVIVGHSFGGAIAFKLLSLELGNIVSLTLINGLLPEHGESVIESYVSTKQSTLIDLVKLDLGSGCVYLQDEEKFKSLAGINCTEYELVSVAKSEPCDILIYLFRYGVVEMSGVSIFYLTAKSDKLTLENIQLDFARKCNAKVIRCDGGHSDALLKPETWIETVFGEYF